MKRTLLSLSILAVLYNNLMYSNVKDIQNVIVKAIEQPSVYNEQEREQAIVLSTHLTTYYSSVIVYDLLRFEDAAQYEGEFWKRHGDSTYKYKSFLKDASNNK